MNNNFNKAFKKTSRGNYFGYYKGYSIFVFKRPHGGWCCEIKRNGEFIWLEGYHGTSLQTLAQAKQWAKFNKLEYID